MSTNVSLYQWLADCNYGGFLVEPARLQRSEAIVPVIGGRKRWAGGQLNYTASAAIRSYTVEWKVALNPATNTALVTPSCTCADWLQSGGWTEKRLCKHLLALAKVTDIPAMMQPLKPEAHVAQEQTGSGAAPQSAPPASTSQSFNDQISKAIGAAIAQVAVQVKEILDEGLVPLLVGPTGCGKTSAIRLVAQSLACRLVEHAGSDAYTDSDLVGVMMPSGLRMPGPVAQALGHAREMGEPVLLFLDEFTRYHLRAQESLMRLLLPIGAEVAASLGINHDGAIRATSAPFWGDEWAPADNVHIALACNPWGTPLDPALVRRTIPVQVTFAVPVAGLFNKRLSTAIGISWKGTMDGTLPLPLEYGELARAKGPDDDSILARYQARLTVLDPAASQAFDALLKGTGV
jgi:hypothetical protein